VLFPRANFRTMRESREKNSGFVSVSVGSGLFSSVLAGFCKHFEVPVDPWLNVCWRDGLRALLVTTTLLRAGPNGLRTVFIGP
jgi:hypothetical protein